MSEQEKLVRQLKINGWIIMLAMSLASLFSFTSEITLGVVIGGLLVTVNLTLLSRVVVKAMAPGSKVTPKSVLPKYYLCFMITLAVIAALIILHLVNGVALLLGLSVFLLDLFSVVLPLAGKIVYKTITKEAV